MEALRPDVQTSRPVARSAGPEALCRDVRADWTTFGRRQNAAVGIVALAGFLVVDSLIASRLAAERSRTRGRDPRLFRPRRLSQWHPQHPRALGDRVSFAAEWREPAGEGTRVAEAQPGW